MAHVTSQRLPLFSVLHELIELSLDMIVLVLPELFELVTVEDVFELIEEFELIDELELIDEFELTDELPETIEASAPPPEVPALTVPDGDEMIAVAACDAT